MLLQSFSLTPTVDLSLHPVFSEMRLPLVIQQAIL